MKSFDVVVIGGGPGGYIAAIRAAQLGLNTACIDEWKGADGRPALGGTCTNVGCIPSKALLQSSENFEHAGHHFAEHGVKVKGLELDLAQMMKRKDKVVKSNNDGIVYLFKKNKITFFHGRGSLKSGSEVQVGDETLQAKHIIIATGSNPRALPGADFDEKLILSNTGALSLPEVPKRLGVIGAHGQQCSRRPQADLPRRARSCKSCGQRFERAVGRLDAHLEGLADPGPVLGEPLLEVQGAVLAIGLAARDGESRTGARRDDAFNEIALLVVGLENVGMPRQERVVRLARRSGRLIVIASSDHGSEAEFVVVLVLDGDAQARDRQE